VLLLTPSGCALLSDPRVQSIASLILDVAAANFPAQATPIRNLVSVVAGFGESPSSLPDVSGSASIRAAFLERTPSGYREVSSGVQLASDSRFALELRTEGAARELYVWVLSIDPTGWPQPLFPGKALGYQNPILPGSTLRLPGIDADYGLDEVKGTHNIYLVVSRQPNPGLDAVLAPFMDRDRPSVRTRSVATIRQPVVLRGESSARGLTNTRPETRPDSKDRIASGLLTAAQSIERVQTLWFVHE